jgi:pimeloyl-ACP methyl ester carboxylesterase
METGGGESIVLIHGAPADHTRWDGFAPRLADRFRLHLVDRRS